MKTSLAEFPGEDFEVPLLPRAACHDVEDPELFFPVQGGEAAFAAPMARAICERCPEAQACLDWALAHDVFGIWGGTSERERRRIQRRTPDLIAPSVLHVVRNEPATGQPTQEQPTPLARVPIPVDAYVRPHVDRRLARGGLDWDALTPTCAQCGEKSGTVNTRSGLCSTCARPVAKPTPAPKQPRQRAPRAPREPRPRRRVVRDPNAPRRSPGTPRWAKPVDERVIVAEYQGGDTAPSIADRHGIGSKRVRDILDRRGIPRRDDRSTHSGGQSKPLDAYPSDLVADVVRRYRAGVTAKQLAADNSVSEHVISNILAKADIPRRLPAHKTKATVLTVEQETEIARRYAAGEAFIDIASAFHIRTSRARQIAAAHGVTIRGRLTTDAFRASREEAS